MSPGTELLAYCTKPVPLIPLYCFKERSCVCWGSLRSPFIALEYKDVSHHLTGFHGDREPRAQEWSKGVTVGQIRSGVQEAKTPKAKRAAPEP